MNMLARNRSPRSLNAEFNSLPLEELVKSVFNYFPGFRSDLIFGNHVNSKLEVEVKDRSVEVKFPCPGRCKEDFELEVVGDFLTVKAVKCCKVENDEKKHYVVRERVCETYEESVKLPVQVKGAETKAKYINGVLEISIPRIEEENPKTHVVTIN
jgi:HSP20 family protein